MIEGAELTSLTLVSYTAIRLGRYFGTSSQFWLNLQTAHDLSVAEAENSYDKIKPRGQEAA